jgi:EmrB/QacA subfamily drug resistance transporter
LGQSLVCRAKIIYLGNVISTKTRVAVVSAALLALFLGALDALIVTAAMPTIASELGGLSLYSWVYSAYFLARAVSLPLFGKLADRYPNKVLFNTAIIIFIAASAMAGAAGNMGFLIFSRAVQGIGSGGIFALVYIVLSDIAEPEARGRLISVASSIWGIASVLGPSMGGFMVTYMSWRWIFWINIPLGLLSLLSITLFLVDVREKRKASALDWAGAAVLSMMILSLLTVFLIGGRAYAWTSPQILLLFIFSTLLIAGFYQIEKKAEDPILSVDFFSIHGFRTGNSAAFWSSFAIFSLFAYAPLYVQGVLSKTPMEVGIAMLSLSLGWSLGVLGLGQILNRLGKKIAAGAGGMFLVIGSSWTLFFSSTTSMNTCFSAFFLVGIGMGFVSLSTLLVVQESLESNDLGVATASHQFFRTLGGTVGVGVCGGLVTGRLNRAMDHFPQTAHTDNISPEIIGRLSQNLETFFQPEMQSHLHESLREVLRKAISHGVLTVFAAVLAASVLCLICCILLPGEAKKKEEI